MMSQWIYSAQAGILNIDTNILDENFNDFILVAIQNYNL